MVTSNKGWKSEKIKLVRETLCHLSAREVTTAENTIAGNPIPGIMFFTPSNANHLLMCECQSVTFGPGNFAPFWLVPEKLLPKKVPEPGRYRENLVPLPENSCEFGTGNGEFPAIFLFLGGTSIGTGKKLVQKKVPVLEKFGPGKKYQYRYQKKFWVQSHSGECYKWTYLVFGIMYLVFEGVYLVVNGHGG